MKMMDDLSHMLAAACLGVWSFDWDHFVDLATEGRIGLRWVVFGLAAQGVIVGCLVAQWRASRKRGRTVLPVPIVYVGLIATVMLLVYASIRHDVVFVAGQLLNVMIALRLIELLRRRGNGPTEPAEEETFPVVEPDTAERMLPGYDEPRDRDEASKRSPLGRG